MDYGLFFTTKGTKYITINTKVMENLILHLTPNT